MNKVKLNVIGEPTLSAEGGSNVKMETLQEIITANGTYSFVPEEKTCYDKADIVVAVSSGGEGSATIDLSPIGYTASDSALVQSKAQQDVAHSKTLYDAWDASKTSADSLYRDNEKLVYAPNIDTSNVTNMSYMFYGCSALTTIPQLDTSNVTTISGMFAGCSALASIPRLDTSNVTDMSNMLNSCSMLTTIPQLDTSKAKFMNYMFQKCSALITIPQLNTSNVMNMSYMFHSCSKLTSIPQLDTSNVTDMRNMFYSCFALTTIPQLDTSNVTGMSNMFYSCSKLENLGGFLNCKVALDLSASTKLTHQSLMNVINNLYDLTANGLRGQTLTIGSTNLAKLTADEIAIATNKGWTVK